MDKKWSKEDIEARGFIFGDGCFMIVKLNRHKQHYRSRKTGLVREYAYVEYRPRVNVTQRADGWEIMEWFKDRYGGSVAENKGAVSRGSNPILQWTTQSVDQCIRIAELCLDSNLPHVKKQAIKPFLEYCYFRKSHSGKYSEEDRIKIEEWRKQVMEANSYKE